MILRSEDGFTLTEFLVTATTLFSSVYFIFWAGFFGSNYSLAQYYLNDYSLCELRIKTHDCWNILKRNVDSIKFIQIKTLDTKSLNKTSTVTLVFNYVLPMPGFSQGLENIRLTSSLDLQKWQ